MKGSLPASPSVPTELAGAAVLDFRTGKNGWGHRLHTGTWRSLGRPRRAWWDFAARSRDRRDDARQHSFMIHAQGRVAVGMKVLWTAADGDVIGTIVEVDPCGNPRDMYSVVVEVRVNDLRATMTPAVSQAQSGNAAAEPRSLLKNPNPERETG